jgi:hypothetical protein
MMMPKNAEMIGTMQRVYPDAQRRGLTKCGSPAAAAREADSTRPAGDAAAVGCSRC